MCNKERQSEQRSSCGLILNGKQVTPINPNYVVDTNRGVEDKEKQPWVKKNAKAWRNMINGLGGKSWGV